MLTITFIRHGESTDNLRAVWAGWADAPLSNHGMNQAKACAEYFSTTKFAGIYCSDLKRANSTAKAIYAAQAEPKPLFEVSPELREQHFGIAEGQPWTIHNDGGMDIANKIFPVPVGRAEKFPEGESLDDLAERAGRIIKEFIMPWINDTGKTWGKKEGNVHIAIVSHGLCIYETLSTLVKLDSEGRNQEKRFSGLANTAWFRATIAVEGEDQGPPPSELNEDTRFIINVTHLNEKDHLEGIVRQKGGIGSAAHDPAQREIREYFGGKVQE